ncbi:MAG: histidine kinase [Leptospirales bacterium]|jgi:LytS/YehU family sensor histidine kinase
MNVSHTSDSAGYDLDADLLTEWLQAVAQSDDRERILECLLRRIVEYSGARRARIVVERSGEFYIRAAFDVSANPEDADLIRLVENGDHIQNCNELSAAVVNFAVHTSQPVLLEDAARGRRFAHDPYIANHRPASLLCLPLNLFGEQRGALYLENSTTRDVFSLERRSPLEMLALQFLQTVRHFELNAAAGQNAKRSDPAPENLREWIQPHFLFNTLNLIQPLIFENASEASRSLNLLADGYRFLVELSGLELVPLEKEWRFMEDYMKLMRLRFGPRLELRIKRPLSFREIEIPPLTLQPLIENALKNRRSDRPHRIDVVAKFSEQNISISVSDNGQGVATQDPFGRSLGKIRQRLQRTFESAELSLENRASENGAEKAGGARVVVRYSRARKSGAHDEDKL